MISIIKKLSRCTCIILLITWLISVFVAVHSSPGARLSTARNSSRESLAGRVYVSRELCQPPHVSCSLVVALLTGQVVTASTHVNELAPVEGLVTPDTKTKKAVYIDASYFNFMLYAVIPRYNCEGVAFSCRLMATRNQYTRNIFRQMYSHTCRYIWYTIPVSQDRVRNGHMETLVEFPVQTVYIGGGRSNAQWSAEELRRHAPNNVPIDGDRYTLIKYVQSKSIDSQMESDSLVVSVPLSVIVQKVSIRLSVEICGNHGVILPRGHTDRARIQAALGLHECTSCADWTCIFRPIRSRSTIRADFRKRNPESTKAAQAEHNKHWRRKQKFPPKPASVDRIQRIIAGFVEGSEFSQLNEKGCAVCGCLTLCSQMVSLQDSGVNTNLLYRPEITRKARKSSEDPIEHLPGPVLASNCDGICPQCFNTLKGGKVPKLSLSNGLWLGDVPTELKNLSWMEKRLIARISTNTCIVRMHASKMFKMKTNVVCRAIPMKKVYDVLPPKREDFEEILAILFIGPSAPTPKEYKRTPLLIRRDRVAAALEWLKLNHSDYADLDISYSNLSEYPEDQPPVHVDYHQNYNDSEGSESTAVNDIDDSESTPDGPAPFIVHGLTGDEVSHLWQADDRRTMRLKAMKYFSSGGKALGIGKSDVMESIWNNPQLYPCMFPWLFPYGLGGMGNEGIPGHIKISDAVRKRHWLMYYDKRFQHDELFSLIAFNHQQIKNSRDGGYMLTLKQNFADVAQRLGRIRISVLEDLIKRSEAGHVVPETDAEKDCFKLLADVDYVATHVDGSVTNRRRMRNEIWSLTSYLGAPSWFITFAPADVNHPIALYYAGDNYTYYPHIVDPSERVRMIAANPVAGARFFKFMVDMFVQHVLGYNNSQRNGLYGKTSGFYGTVEQQGRLTLHMHMLIWMKDNPNPRELRERIMSGDSDFQKRMVQYLESAHIGEFTNTTMASMEELVKKRESDPKHISPTLRLPNRPKMKCSSSCGNCQQCMEASRWLEDYRDEVNEIAYRSNRHTCHKGCITTSHPTCKSRFPREVYPQTLVDTDTGALVLKKGEAWMNYYTPALTYLLRCNTDVTNLQSGTAVRSVIQYVTDYITKSPLKTHVMFDAVKTIFTRMEESTDSWSDDVAKKTRMVVTKIVNSLTSQSEIGSPMAAMYLLNHPDHYTDHKFERFYWKRYVNEVRSAFVVTETDMDSAAVIESVSNDVQHLPQLDSTQLQENKIALGKNTRGIVGLSPVYDYMYRPEKYKDVCLYDWIRLARKSKQSKKKKSAKKVPDDEWVVSCIKEHKWIKDASNGQLRVLFKILWDAGDSTWEPLHVCEHLEALDIYYNKCGVTHWKQLSHNLNENSSLSVTGNTPDIDKNTDTDTDTDTDSTLDDCDAELEDDSDDETEDLLEEADEIIEDTGHAEEDCDEDESEESRSSDSTAPNNVTRDSQYHMFASFLNEHPQCESHRVRVVSEKEARVPDFVGGILPRKDKGNMEDYCLTMLTLFKPWRTGLELKDSSGSWKETFDVHQFSTRQIDVMKNFHLRYECRDARDDFAAQRKAKLSMRGGWPAVFDDDEMDDMCDNTDRAIDRETTEFMEDDDWEEHAAKNDSSTRQIDRMIEAEVMLDKNGLLDTDFKPTVDINSLPAVKDVTPSAHYWKTLLDTERQGILTARQSRAALAKTKSTGFNQNDTTVNKVEVIDQSYFEKSFIPSNPSDRILINNTIKNFTLNKEQARAFSIIANHATLTSPPQLKMYLGGMAGTGKSQVIKSLIHFFKERNEEHRLMCMAPTGSAASLIGGSTYHSVLGINPYREKNDLPAALTDVRLTLGHVDYVFLDEVSMLDCASLYNISKQMCLSLGIDEEPFGGKNMIMAGDFAQLPPINVSKSLYSQEVVSVLHTTQSHSEQEAALGKAIWHQFTTAVILRDNMRQKSQTEDDAKFRKLLENLRYKSCTKEDIQLLKKRVASKSFAGRNWSDNNFRNVSVVTSYNATRDKLNERGAERFAKETKQSLKYFYSIDRYNSDNVGKRLTRRAQKKIIDPLRRTDRLSASDQFMYWSLPACCSTNHVGRLAVCMGMPVMVKKNKATECGVTNGAEGTVVGWRSRPIDRKREALEVLFIKLSSPPVPIKLEGLDENVVPIVAESINVSCKLPTGKKQTINRTQVPVILNFAMTDYASQGRTRKYNVVDIQNCRSHQSIYTCLSRGSTYLGTLLTQTFSDKHMCGGMDGYLRQEFRELELLDEITNLRFNRQMPSGVGGITRNYLISSYRKSKGAEYIPKTMPDTLRWSKTANYEIEDPFDEASWEIVDPKKKAKDKKISPKSDKDDLNQAKPDTKKPAPRNKMADRNLVAAIGTTKLEATSTVQGANIRRKRKLIPDEGKVSHVNGNKRIRTCFRAEQEIDSPIPYGFTWNSSTYSCAFDSLFTVLFNIMKDGTGCWNELISQANENLALFDASFEEVEVGSQEMMIVKDTIHQEMADKYPQVFNTTSAGNDVLELCRYMLDSDKAITMKSTYCNRCKREVSLAEAPNNRTTWTCSKSAWSKKARPIGTCNSQTSNNWMKALMRTKTARKCPQCKTKVDLVYHFREPPSFIVLSIIDGLNVSMQHVMNASGYDYKLRGLIYHGDHHFSCRVIDETGGIWFHDGIHTKSVCEYEGDISQVEPIHLMKARHGRRCILGIYALA